MEAEDSEESHSTPKAPKKSRLGLVLAIVAVTVLVTGAAVAGTVFGPALLGRGKADQELDAAAKGKAKSKDKDEKDKGKEAETVGETVELSPIMVDARAEDGNLHHIKVVIAVEISEGTKKDEFMRYAPRGREAAVGFLRSESFDKLVAPANYADVRVELTGPDGDAWTWGDEASPDRIEGDALDFCLLVTQRRHRDDTALRITGPGAHEWASFAQAFAGPAGPGRKPGEF